MEKSKQTSGCKAGWYWLLALGLIAVCPLMGVTQTVAFEDDFSGDLSKWQVLGNPGNAEIIDGQLVMEWGYAPNWFVTKNQFNYDTGLQYDIFFADGGFQEAANFKRMNMQPLLGATDVNGDNGGVISTFSFQAFSLMRQVHNAAGATEWKTIRLSKNTSFRNQIMPGVRIKVEIDPDGLQGGYYINGEIADRFMVTTGTPLSGGMGFRDVVSRDIAIDDVKFYQIAADGTETILLEDNFNRTDVGTDWVNETLGADPAPGPLSLSIQDGALNITNDGSGDTWVRTAAEATFVGSTTVFEFTFVGYLSGSTYNPSLVVGTQAYTPGVTSNVLLFDNGAGFNYGMVNGGWAGGQARGQGSVGPGMRFKLVIDKGAQSGRSYRNDVEVARFKTLGPALQGGFAFRSILNRDATIDDIRIYTVGDDGTETDFFVDNFNRDTLGEDWVIETITPGGWEEAMFADVFDVDGDGDNEMAIDHIDDSYEDSWCRLDKVLPFGDKQLVIEGTYVFIPNGYASVCIGTEHWVENETMGPLLLDNLDTVWGMDTRGGNVWVSSGPLAGTKVSLVVNPGGRSGSLMTNDVVVTEWELAASEAPIPAGFVGIRDPYDAPRNNVAPGSGTAKVIYDDIRVTLLGGSAVNDWMLQ
ncbi:MAG: hypothetical protein RBU29_04365 [bacterium]|jgi:hypothetical protein|nr:hypothetical protein [bacterium]